MSSQPQREAGNGYIGLRDYFTLWLNRLEVYYDRRFQDLDNKTSLALAGADKAVLKAEAATEKRFEGVNEFRQTLSDQASLFLPRSEYIVNHEALQRDVDAIGKEIQNRREADANRAEDAKSSKQSWMIPMILLGGLGLINLMLNLYQMTAHK